MDKSHVVVLGGGPGGYAAAFMAADLGMQVTLVNEEKNPGGVCLYRGCIPSKALLHAAKVLTEAREASHFGIVFEEPKIDLKKLAGWKSQVVEKLTGGLGQLAKQRKVNYVQGRGTFLDAHTLKVGDEKLPFEYCILASGSRPAIPPMLKLDSKRVMDSTGALQLEDVPERLLVVGGGYIGLELGTVYAALGSKVSVVEMTPGLLPGADRDLVKILHKRLEGAFHKIHLNTKVNGLREDKNEIVVSMTPPEGEAVEERFDRVLVSVGRRPNSENLGLENTKVEIDPRGFVKIDAQCRTAEPSIFCIGDVSGEPGLAHRATHQGRLAAEVIHGSKAQFEPQAIPAVVFTDPEIAWCGLTEAQAKEQGIAVEVARYPWAASGRALSLHRPEGVTKLVIDPKESRILGVGICGPGAGELIAEGVLAMEMGCLVEDLGLTIHAHPTLSETIMEAADVFFGKSTHMYKPKR